MPSFGRSLSRFGVDYLLVSGQASVLYQAATFSEDVDLWVRADAGNLQRLRKALAALRARVRSQLTPPLTLTHARRGHGFHFLLPSVAGPVELDVMGNPPRVAPFRECRARAVPMSTAWGPMPVIAIEDLVEIKKTRRLRDYDVISNLVRVRLVAAGSPPSDDLLRWALANGFDAEGLDEILERNPRARRIAARMRRPAVRRLMGTHRRAERIRRCRRALAQEITEFQERDVAFWRPVLADLRRLRTLGRLLPKDSLVRTRA